MIDSVAGHRPNETDIIQHRTGLRKQLTDFSPGLPEFLELKLRPVTDQWLTLELRKLLPLGHAIGHGLAMHFRQLRLVIKRLQMRGTTGHGKEYHSLGSGREMQGIDQPFPLIGAEASRCWIKQ